MRNDDDPQGFIARVEAARSQAGLGRNAFSTAIDQGGAYWSVWITRHKDRGGFPAGNVMAKMSRVLGVSMEYLLGSESGAPSPEIQIVALADLLARIGARPVADGEGHPMATRGEAGSPNHRAGRGRRPAIPARLQRVAVTGRGLEPLVVVGDVVHADIRRAPGPGELALAVRAPDAVIVRFVRERDGVRLLEDLDGATTTLDGQTRIIGQVVAVLLTTARLLERRA